MLQSSENFFSSAKDFLFKKSIYNLISNHKLINYKNLSAQEYPEQLSRQNFLPRTKEINAYPFCSFEDINNHV